MTIDAIDAMGCQKKITKKIISAGADYAIAVKGNQKYLFEDVKYFLVLQSKQTVRTLNMIILKQPIKDIGVLKREGIG